MSDRNEVMNVEPPSLVDRLHEAASRVAKHCMGGETAPLISIPAAPDNVDVVMADAAGCIAELEAENSRLRVLLGQAGEALEPVAAKKVPKKPVANAGVYSFRFDEIEAAKAVLTAIKGGEDG